MCVNKKFILTTLQEAWVILATIGLLTFFLIYPFYAESKPLETYGQWIGGAASAVAFLWLIAGYAIQRNELTLQRQALQQQSLELNRMGKFAALEQVQRIVEKAEAKLKEDFPEIGQQSTWFKYVVPNRSWKTILESEDAEEIMKIMPEYLKTQGSVMVFMNSMAQAARLYAEATNYVGWLHQADNYEFLYINSSALQQIPYLNTYAGTIRICAQTIWTTKPAQDAFSLAFIVAIAVACDTQDLLNKEEMKKSYEKLKAIPAICKYYDFD